jgi:hypothetical protein
VGIRTWSWDIVTLGSLQESPRSGPVSHATLASIEYPAHFEVRRVSRNGGIRWHAPWVNVSHIFADQHVGFEEIDKGAWTVYFGSLDLGRRSCGLTTRPTSVPLAGHDDRIRSMSNSANVTGVHCKLIVLRPT